MEPPAGSSAMRGTGVFMPRHCEYRRTDNTTSAESSKKVERSAHSAGMLQRVTGCSNPRRRSSSCSNLRSSIRTHATDARADASDPPNAVPAHCTMNYQGSQDTSAGCPDSYLLSHSLPAQLSGFMSLALARETSSNGLPPAPPGEGPPAAATSSHTSMHSNQACLPPIKSGDFEVPAAPACYGTSGRAVGPPLAVQPPQWGQVLGSTWSDTRFHTLSRVSSAPVMEAGFPGTVPLSQGPQLLLQPHMCAAPAAPFGSEEVLFALQQQLAAADAGAGNSAAAGDQGLLLGLTDAKAVPHSFNTTPGLVLEQQLQAPCAVPIGIVPSSMSYGSLQLGSSTDCCSTSVISTVPTGGALDAHLAPASAAAPASSNLAGDSIWGSSVPRSLSHNVSGMAVAVAQHKLEQIAALEVLQQQLQQDVADLLQL